MTSSELVERLQKIIEEEGDFEVEYLDFGEYGATWPFPIENVKIQCNNFSSVNKFKKTIGIY